MASFAPIDPTVSKPERRFPRDPEPRRPVRAYLQKLALDRAVHDRRNCWGFTLFRTVYTPESNEAFTKAVDRLRVWAENWANDDIFLPPLPGREPRDPTPNRELVSRYYNDIIEDVATLDGASVEEVGRRFDAWVEEHWKRGEPDAIVPHTGEPYYMRPNARYKACIMVDQEVLDQILLMPEVRGSRDPAIEDRWVKMVTNEQSPPEEGVVRRWLRVGICGRLWFLWWAMSGDGRFYDFGELDEAEGVRNHYGREPWR